MITHALVHARISHSAVKVVAYSSYNKVTISLPSHTSQSNGDITMRLTLQLSCPLPKNLRQIIQIITRRDAEFTHEVPRCAFQVAVVPVLVRRGYVVLGTPEIGVARDRCRTFEPLQSALCLGLCRRVEVVAAEEFVGRDAFLVSEFGAGVFLVVRCRQLAFVMVRMIEGVGNTFGGRPTCPGRAEAHSLRRCCSLCAADLPKS